MRPYFEIVRPLNVLITFISVFLVLFLVRSDNVSAIVWAGLTASLICAGANVINDYFDLEIDRINRPDRVLASGAMIKENAFRYSIVISILGVFCSIPLGGMCFGLALFAVIGLYIYSWKLKTTALWGNFTVSFFAGLAFIGGGLAVEKVKETFIPAVFTFLFHFGREILKDVEDQEGDAKMQAHTLPIVYGVKVALWLTTVCFVFLIMVMAGAYIAKFYSELFLITVCIGVIPVLIWTIISMWKNNEPKNLKFLNRLLKVGMFAGLLAMYLG